MLDYQVVTHVCVAYKIILTLNNSPITLMHILNQTANLRDDCFGGGWGKCTEKAKFRSQVSQRHHAIR